MKMENQVRSKLYHFLSSPFYTLLILVDIPRVPQVGHKTFVICRDHPHNWK